MGLILGVSEDLEMQSEAVNCCLIFARVEYTLCDVRTATALAILGISYFCRSGKVLRW